MEIATDHGGFGLKEEFVGHLRAAGHKVVDFAVQSIKTRLDGDAGVLKQLASAVETYDPLFEIRPGTKPPAQKPKAKEEVFKMMHLGHMNREKQAMEGQYVKES